MADTFQYLRSIPVGIGKRYLLVRQEWKGLRPQSRPLLRAAARPAIRGRKARFRSRPGPCRDLSVVADDQPPTHDRKAPSNSCPHGKQLFA